MDSEQLGRVIAAFPQILGLSVELKIRPLMTYVPCIERERAKARERVRDIERKRESAKSRERVRDSDRESERARGRGRLRVGGRKRARERSRERAREGDIE